MKQGDIVWANLNPTQGSEQTGIRPVVIISGNAMNQHFDVVIACPLSTKIKHFPGCVVIEKDPKNGLQTDSEVITFQLRTIAKQRLKSKIGEISLQQLQAIIQGLNDVLTY
jgi:mRNA interferase MazF